MLKVDEDLDGDSWTHKGGGTSENWTFSNLPLMQAQLVN